MSIVKFDNVSKLYAKGVRALENINLEINEGEFVYVQGRSGSGKSTFAKLIYREEHPSSGDIEVAGYDVDELKNSDVYKLRRKVGVVFQDYKLLRNKTVYENVAYAMEVLGFYEDEIRERVVEVLEFVGLAHKSNVFPGKLSGGEQQRVAIARAIVNHPKIIVADEPTGNLDPSATFNVINLLERINMQGTTVIMVTHNHQVVNKFRHRVITIDGGKVVLDEPDGEGLDVVGGKI